jgi:hypothetical protein
MHGKQKGRAQLSLDIPTLYPITEQLVACFFGWCGEWCPSAFNSFELPSWMLYQDVQLLWDSGLGRGESGYLL